MNINHHATATSFCQFSCDEEVCVQSYTVSVVVTVLVGFV